MRKEATIVRSHRSTQVRLRARLKNQRASESQSLRRPFLEALEDRRLLAVVDSSNLALPDLTSREHRADSLIVQFRDGASTPGSLAAHLLTANLQEEWTITPGMRRVDLTSTADLAAALLAFRNDPNVSFVEPDYRVSLQQTPDDPSFDSLWGMNNEGQTGGLDDSDIDAPEAWDVTKGSSSTIVAVIDTGIDYTHPDLAANIWTNPGEIAGNGKDDDSNGYIDDVHGFDFVNRDGDPMDDHFHGTHVAGTIGAVGDNGIGIAGVNWNVSIMALKFLDSTGGGYESDAISALNYAVANGATISNNSWGGLGFSPAFETALKNAATKGHIFVAAAGNDGWNNDLDAFFPAGYDVPNVISVAATDRFDNLAWFSNYGLKSVDLAAPGVDIYSTFPTRMTGAMRDGGFTTNYDSISGTSMATPHVTGVLALVRSLHKDEPEFTYQQVIERVIDTVDVIDGATKTITGGRLNAAAAVGNAPPDATGPRVVAIDPTSAVGTIDRVRLRFNEGIDATTVSLDDVISLIGPDGSITTTEISPVAGNNRQFDLKFPAQSTLGEYTLILDADINDLTGNLLDQDRDGQGGEDPDDTFTATFVISDQLSFNSPDVPKHIDVLDFLFGQPVESVLTVGPNINISDLNLTLDIYYVNDEELKIYLRSPSGTEVTLVDQFEAFGEGFFNTTFDDEGSTPFGNGFAPYQGSYRPSVPLSSFDGESAAGTWTLVIEAYLGDFLAGEGDLFSWSLDISGEDDGTPPPPPPPPPPPGNRAPIATDDTLSGEVNTRLAITPAQLLANDQDPDGDELTIKFVGSPSGGSVAIDGDQLITFTPNPDFEGEATFEYVVYDPFKLNDTGVVRINFAPVAEWHNSANANDVDNDTTVTANDVLTIINFINATGATSVIGLSSGVAPESYYDVTADNFIGPDDVIAVINYINSHPDRPTSNSPASASNATDAEVDAALLSLMTEGDGKRK